MMRVSFYIFNSDSNNQRISVARRFCKVVCGSLVIIMISFCLVSECVLHRLHEDIIGDDAIEVQLNEPSLYGSALLNDMSYHKLGIVEARQPEIIAIGSSRVMQFRKEFFQNADFYTMGGTVSNLNDALFITDELLKRYHPRVIIIGVDLWWLNPNFKFNQSHTQRGFFEKEGWKRTFIYARLWDSLETNKKIRQAALDGEGSELDRISMVKTLGLKAAAQSTGYRSNDGSYQYGDHIPETKTIEERLEDTFNRIEKGISRFECASSVDVKELQKLQELIKKMKNNNVDVVVFLPPFPDATYTKMETDTEGHGLFLHEFEDSVSKLCADENVSCYDFSNLKWFGAPDEEIIDGFHGTEKAYARMMLKMENDKLLGNFIATDYIRKWLGIYIGSN